MNNHSLLIKKPKTITNKKNNPKKHHLKIKPIKFPQQKMSDNNIFIPQQHQTTMMMMLKKNLVIKQLIMDINDKNWRRIF